MKHDDLPYNLHALPEALSSEVVLLSPLRTVQERMKYE